MSRDLPLSRPTDSKPRSCGDCTACCSVLGVDEIEKAAGVPCTDLRSRTHGRSGGCSRYDTRPESCQVYRCFWLDGIIDRQYRPDKIGLVFDAATGQGRLDRVRKATGIPVMIAREVWPGAARHPKGRTLLEGLAKVIGVFVVGHPADDGKPTHPARTVLGPPAVIKAMLGEIQAAGLEARAAASPDQPT